MEAQGIEPWSEWGSRTASTCVGSISTLSRSTGIGPACRATTLAGSRSRRWGTTSRQSGFAIRRQRPGRAL